MVPILLQHAFWSLSELYVQHLKQCLEETFYSIIYLLTCRNLEGGRMVTFVYFSHTRCILI